MIEILPFALFLAQTCVAEIGLHEESTVEECELMWSINKAAAIRRKISPRKHTRQFNSYWQNNPQSRRQRAKRPYIQYLGYDEQPKRWPSNMRWSRFKGKWLRFREAAIKFVYGIDDPEYFEYHGCDAAVDYGAPGEIPEGDLVPVTCLGGKTRQRYWRAK